MMARPPLPLHVGNLRLNTTRRLSTSFVFAVVTRDVDESGRGKPCYCKSLRSAESCLTTRAHKLQLQCHDGGLLGQSGCLLSFVRSTEISRKLGCLLLQYCMLRTRQNFEMLFQWLAQLNFLMLSIPNS